MYLAQISGMKQDPYHYAVIKRAIEHIEASVEGQPSLEGIAQAVGLSPSHFQRVFSQWTGVSPKRYQQYLTLDLAKSLLQNRHSLLETSLQTGLSGSSRLHDLFIRWEAMTPGEYALKGKGLEISFGWFPSQFGEMLAMGTSRGLCGLGFVADFGRAVSMIDLTSRWPEATFVEAPEKIAAWVEAATGNGGETKLHLIGAPFQVNVWQALLQIPKGHVTTYSDIAAAIERPKAVRAVGTAVGRNPVSWLIPCHRALRKSGGLGGYHWGIPTKRALLAWESARLEAAQ